MHFTYEPKPDIKVLCQGDVLTRTEGIDAILREVHPHYLKDDYKYLMVLTQTCDLVRRFEGNRCASRYLTLVAVRPLRLVVERQIERYQHHALEREFGFCNSKNRPKIEEFMESLLNNNNHDFFYLHKEPTIEFIEPHCAFLALSIAVKSEIHYDTCLAAKRLQLSESFQHKLGWLTGNLYSRVGTSDWTP